MLVAAKTPAPQVSKADKIAAITKDKPFLIESLDAYAANEEDVNYWWAMYQEGFTDELKWLENKGQETSLSLGTNAVNMYAMTFKDRFCFVTRMRDSKEICGYIVVDDLSKTKTNFAVIRMVLVAAKHRNQGMSVTLMYIYLNEIPMIDYRFNSSLFRYQLLLYHI